MESERGDDLAGDFIQVGKRRVAIQFGEDGTVMAAFGEFTSRAASCTADAIAEACRTVVTLAAKAEQEWVARRRALEDARRLLGN